MKLNNINKNKSSNRLSLGALSALILFFCGAIGFPAVGQTANKALLIGVGSYQNPAFNLTGIDLDLATMNRFAKRLGFLDKNIKTITGPSATRENIDKMFKNFLATDMSPTDTVLLYYSGHGVQLSDNDGDEPDQRDEALTLHNLRESKRGYDGVLLDDELAVLLKSLPSENVVVIIDACHSGTATRGITSSLNLKTKAYGIDDFQVKALPFRPAPLARSLASSKSAPPNESLRSGVVTLSAAQDNEKALATTRGSTFTLALAEALDVTSNNASAKALIDHATSIISERVDPKYLFRPNLSGDPSRFGKSLRLLPKSAPEVRSNWSDLKKYTGSAKKLKARLNQADYLNNEPIEISIQFPAKGYLNILSVDADDSLYVLYPNKFNPDNEVSKGKLALPGDYPFEWVALEPWGSNLLIPIFTQRPLNLYTTSLQKSQSGDSDVYYAIPSLDMLRMLGIGTKKKPSVKSRTLALEFKTCLEAGRC